jgi:hypothetical protein
VVAVVRLHRLVLLDSDTVEPQERVVAAGATAGLTTTT